MTQVVLPVDVFSAPQSFMDRLTQIFGDFEELVHLLMASPSFTEFEQYCDASAWSMVEAANAEGFIQEAAKINQFWTAPTTNLWLMDFYDYNRGRAEYLVGTKITRFDSVENATRYHALVTIK